MEDSEEKVKQLKKYDLLIREKRRCGNTTRFIDQFIQDLFDNGEVTIFDHYSSNSITNKLNDRISKTIIQRLELEHKVIILYSVNSKPKNNQCHVYFNRKTYTFKLIN